MARRVAELADDPTTPLFFGRLDFGGPRQPAQRDHDEARGYHVGRRHVTDERGRAAGAGLAGPDLPLVLPGQRPRPAGRRASGAGSGSAPALLTSFEDEHLDRGEELGTASRILTAEIERPRVGPMRDIVATIQPEQDELVRADLADSICVQGAPGTGKTAVGLHRAAYLLYLHRERLRRSGVLIVGPNRAFLSYIAAVLPALGEVEVAQATVEDLVARVPVRAVDDPAVAALKHDVRMAEVLRRRGRGAHRHADRADHGVGRLVPLADRPRPAAPGGRGDPPGGAAVRAPVGSGSGPGWSGCCNGRPRRAAPSRRATPGCAGWAKARPVTAFLDAVWPALTPEGLVHALLADPDALAAAADGLLTADEQALLRLGRSRPRTAEGDEVDRRRRGADRRGGRADRAAAGFGHVVVDEAQDLSPMQCRAIARRSEHGSITLLGDLAQGTAPWAATDWRESLAHLGKPDAVVVPLTHRLPGAGGGGRVRQPAAAGARCRRTAGRVAAPRRRARRAYGDRPGRGDGGRGARGARARRLGRRDRRRRRGGRGCAAALADAGVDDRDAPTTWRPRRGSPWCRRPWSRAWSTTTWWSSSRPRSSRPSRAGCTASTWC